MNLGFASLEPHARPIDLTPADEKDRHCIQLYHHVTAAVSLSGLRVLEIGCGRGGGCSYLLRYLHPHFIVGLDICSRGIILCKKQRAAAGLWFCQGDAEALPFAQASFDVVISVESSHCYPSKERFFSEVSSVLRPTGRFLLADLCGSDDSASLRGQLSLAGLTVVKEEIITPNVFVALQLDSRKKSALIKERVPWVLRSAFQAFAGVEGTTLYERVRQGRADYISYVLRKSDQTDLSNC